MTATVETLDGLNRRLTINLNQAEIEAEVGRRLSRVARNVRIDGFRPGKAPLKLVAARYSGEIRGEVLGDALQKQFGEAVQANNIAVAGYPRFSAGEGGVFVATFEVFPEVKLGDVSTIKVTRPHVDVTDADIDRTIEVLRKQRVRYQAVEREARDGDRVHIDYQGKIDGVAFPGGDAKDFPLILGEGRTLKDFEGSLVGMKAGESRVFDVAFPADYFAKELAGKTATFEATMKSVHEPHLPELDEAFAASLGIHEGGIAKLCEEIRGNLAREAKRRIQAKVKEQALSGLLEISPFDLPGGLVEMERRALMEKAVTDLKARGMKETDIKLGEEVFDAQARRRVALGLLMDAIVQEHKLTAEDAQIRATIDEFAQSYEDPSEVVDWYYRDETRLKEARALVLEENIVAWLLERAQVTDDPISLEKLMGNA
jgi:trigger factor